MWSIVLYLTINCDEVKWRNGYVYDSTDFVSWHAQKSQRRNLLNAWCVLISISSAWKCAMSFNISFWQFVFNSKPTNCPMFSFYVLCHILLFTVTNQFCAQGVNLGQLLPSTYLFLIDFTRLQAGIYICHSFTSWELSKSFFLSTFSESSSAHSESWT